MNHHRHESTDLADLADRGALRGLLTGAVPEPPHRIDTDHVIRLATQHRRKRMGLVGAGAAALAVVLTGGLATTLATTLSGDRGTNAAASPASTADPLEGADLSDISEAQAAEIDDRVITQEEYDAAFERFRECMRAGGFDIGGGYKVDGVNEYSVSSEAVDSGLDEECDDREYYFTDVLWQSVLPSRTSPPPPNCCATASKIGA